MPSTAGAISRNCWRNQTPSPGRKPSQRTDHDEWQLRANDRRPSARFGRGRGVRTSKGTVGSPACTPAPSVTDPKLARLPCITGYCQAETERRQAKRTETLDAPAHPTSARIASPRILSGPIDRRIDAYQVRLTACDSSHAHLKVSNLMWCSFEGRERLQQASS